MTVTGKLLDLAKVMVEAAEKKAIEIDVPMVICVCDMGGNNVLLHRMEDSLLVSLEVAQNKAYTAVALKQPSANLASLAADGGALQGIAVGHAGKVVYFGGGFPIIVDGKIIGGLGISGGSVEEDCSCCEAALAAIK